MSPSTSTSFAKCPRRVEGVDADVRGALPCPNTSGSTIAGCFEEVLRDNGQRSRLGGDPSNCDDRDQKAARYIPSAPRRGCAIFPGAADAIPRRDLLAVADRDQLRSAAARRSTFSPATAWASPRPASSAVDLGRGRQPTASPTPKGTCWRSTPCGRWSARTSRRHIAWSSRTASLGSTPPRPPACGPWVSAHTYTEAELRAGGADAIVPDLTGLDPDWVLHFFIPEVSP